MLLVKDGSDQMRGGPSMPLHGSKSHLTFPKRQNVREVVRRYNPF